MATAIKLPQLWTSDVEGWFLLIESQFTLRAITVDETKFHHVVASLDSSVSSAVRAVLRRPPSYKDLKAALIAKYSLTPLERAASIRAITNIGGRKPSEVMDDMLLLLGDNQPDVLFRHHFVSILPDFVRNVLSFSETTDPAELAVEADRIFISGRPGIPSNSVFDVNQDDASVDHVSRQRRKQPSNKFCYYHRNFGARAHKCSQPCAWLPGNDTGGQQ